MIIPVPIPNTEVKRSHADGTAEMRESRTPPGLFYALRAARPRWHPVHLSNADRMQGRRAFFVHSGDALNLEKKFSTSPSF